MDPSFLIKTYLENLVSQTLAEVAY